MLTSQEILEELLLDGRKVNKFTFLHESGSVCLAQRILDRSRAIKGKGTLREYWLEPEEIQRIKGNLKPFKEVKQEAEQLAEDNKNLAEKATESLESETKAYYEEEQVGLGLPWQ